MSWNAIENVYWNKSSKLYTLQIASSQLRSTYEDGDNAIIAKAFSWAILIEAEPTFLLITKEVEIIISKIL